MSGGKYGATHGEIDDALCMAFDAGFAGGVDDISARTSVLVKEEGPGTLTRGLSSRTSPRCRRSCASCPGCRTVSKRATSHSPADIRDIDHIPLPILQSRSGQVLKVDRLLLELLLALRERLRRGNAPAVLADLGEVRGREELLEEVTAGLAGGADDEGGFGGHGEEDEGKVQDTDSVLVMVSP